MKKACKLLILAFGLYATSFAQSSTNIPAGIPKQVYYMQLTKFPTGTDLVWKVLADNTYEVTFKIKGKAGFVHYGKNFAAQESHSEIDSASLPRAIVHSIDSLYKGARYQNVAHFETSTPLQNDEPFLKYAYDYYQVLLTKEKNTYKLYFSPDGTLLNRIERKIGQ